MRLFAAVACLRPRRPRSPAGAAADWRHDLKVLRVGFLISGDPGCRHGAHRAVPRLSRRQARLAGRSPAVASTYGALIDAETTGRVQYAINSATSFATAEAPLRLPRSAGRADRLRRRARLLRHAARPRRQPDPLARRGEGRPHRAVRPEILSPGGWCRCRPSPPPASTRRPTSPPPSTSPGRSAAIAALLSGEADLAVAWSSLRGDPAAGYSFGVLTRMVAAGASVDGPRATSSGSRRLIPFGPHALRRDTPPEVKPILLDALAWRLPARRPTSWMPSTARVSAVAGSCRPRSATTPSWRAWSRLETCRRRRRSPRRRTEIALSDFLW